MTAAPPLRHDAVARRTVEQLGDVRALGMPAQGPKGITGESREQFHQCAVRAHSPWRVAQSSDGRRAGRVKPPQPNDDRGEGSASILAVIERAGADGGSLRCAGVDGEGRPDSMGDVSRAARLSGQFRCDVRAGPSSHRAGIARDDCLPQPPLGHARGLAGAFPRAKRSHPSLLRRRSRLCAPTAVAAKLPRDMASLSLPVFLFFAARSVILYSFIVGGALLLHASLHLVPLPFCWAVSWGFCPL